MEHRSSQRLRVNIKVDTYRDGRHVGRCRVRDANRSGIFLEHCFEPFATGQCLALHFRFEMPPAHRSAFVKAMVVHSGPAGAGVIFADGDRHDPLLEPFQSFIEAQA